MIKNFKTLQFFAACAIMILLCVSNANAQYNRLRGASSTQICLGITDVGLALSLYYLKSFDQKVKAGFGGGFNYGKVHDINYKSVFVDGLGSYSTYNGNRIFYVNVLGGLSFVGDFKNSFPSDTYHKDFNLNYGILGGLEAEFLVSRKVTFILNALQRYYIKKDFGQWRYQANAGIRFTL